MIVVSNASPLIYLAASGHLDVLRELYERVVIPEAVRVEVIEQGEGKAGYRELTGAAWLATHEASATPAVLALQSSLGAGESEALALALELSSDLLLMDDRLGRRAAHRLGIRVLGTVGVLVGAKHKGIVPAVKPVLDDLREKLGFRLSDAVYRRVLEDEGEAKESL